MTQPMSSVGIRLEGTMEQIEDCLTRLGNVLSFNYPAGKQWRDTDHVEVKLAYIRAYLYDRVTLWNQLEAAKRDMQELQEILGEVELENQKLKQRLKELPRPKSYDAVLGRGNSIRHLSIPDRNSSPLHQ